MNNITQTVLVAEDEHINYLFIEELLLEQEIKIIHAKNGQEAVDLALKHPEINLILMDIKMPIMNGLDASRPIKKQKPNLPIIAVTGYVTEAEIEKIMEAGCDGFISKPIYKNKLIECLNKYLIIN